MTVLNLAVFLGLMILLALDQARGAKLSRRVLLGLAAGVVAGFLLQLVYGVDNPIVAETLAWTNVIGKGYVSLLKMMIMPLILVMMIAAVLRLEKISALGRFGGAVIGLLLGTTMVAALVGVLVATGFNLSADGLTQGARELERLDVLIDRQSQVADFNVPAMLVSLLPTNIFADLSGTRSTSIIAVVIFSILAGIAALLLIEEAPEMGERIRSSVEVVQRWVLQLVRLVISLTPYGVLALMTKVVATSDASDILNLVAFVVASYLAIAIMFLVHTLLLFIAGISPVRFFQKVWPVLAFAFTSRSSAATIPLNIEAQIEELGVSPPIANLSASFGATIGQNGCAGIYPAMLAAMIAPGLGIDPLSPAFLFPLLGIVTISSFGVAGVGGGATFAALIVLPAMGLPVTLVALLISIEPLIDMARTALNVNGAMTAGVVTDRFFGDGDEIAESLSAPVA